MKKTVDEGLRTVQYTLFRLGGAVSTRFTKTYIVEEDIKFLEQEIDEMTGLVGALKNFIYYSGSEASTYCQVVRSVIRRTERAFVRFVEGQYDYTLDYQYINRLADYVFTLARYLNHVDGRTEEVMVLK